MVTNAVVFAAWLALIGWLAGPERGSLQPPSSVRLNAQDLLGRPSALTFDFSALSPAADVAGECHPLRLRVAADSRVDPLRVRRATLTLSVNDAAALEPIVRDGQPFNYLSQIGEGAGENFLQTSLALSLVKTLAQAHTLSGEVLGLPFAMPRPEVERLAALARSLDTDRACAR